MIRQMVVIVIYYFFLFVFLCNLISFQVSVVIQQLFQIIEDLKYMIICFFIRFLLNCFAGRFYFFL